MIRGATQEFILTLNTSIALSSIESYCLAFGRNEKRMLFDIYESRETDSSASDYVPVVTGDSESSLSFTRGKFYSASESSSSSRAVYFSIKITEEESLSLKAGTSVIQLKIMLTTGDILLTEQQSFEVEDALCEKEMNSHE